MIEYRNVTKKYGNKVIIENLNLTVEEGQFVSLIGASGCGKTTTLKMLNGLIPYNSGDILINGESISNYNPSELRRKIGYVIQSIGLFPNMTVEQNIGVVPELLKWDKEKIADRVKELMDIANMSYSEYANKFPNQLSGGQQQRIGVLRALAADPEIVLMDEPFGALDPITRDIMQIEVRNLQKKLKKTIVFVTHDMDEAIKMSDVIVFMDKGSIIQKASPAEMLSHPANEIVSDFLGMHSNAGNKEQELLCKDVMRTPAIIGNKNISMREAVWIMKTEKIDTLILVDNDGKYYGVIDLETVASSGRKTMKAKDLSSDEFETLDINDPAKDAFSILQQKAQTFIIVVKNDEPVGIVTRTALSMGMADFIWGQGADED